MSHSRNRPVVFSTYQPKMGSGRLRAVQIAEALSQRGLDSRVVDNCENVRNAFLVYIKGTGQQQLERARSNGNIVILDHIDPHQNHLYRTVQQDPPVHRRFLLDQLDPALLDGVIFVNSAVQKQYKDYGSGLHKTVILHPWDNRFTTPKTHNAFQLGMLGHSSDLFNLPGLQTIHLPRHILNDEMIEACRHFSCHLSVRLDQGAHTVEKHGLAELAFHSKSNIKVSTAAACDANIICSRDAGSLEILPEDYPFWYDTGRPLSEFIEQVKQGYGGMEWRSGLDIMREIRERTSTSRIADDYIEYFSHWH